MPMTSTDVDYGHVNAEIASRHLPGCEFRRGALLPVGFPCRHGYEECLECDPCTCDKIRKEST